MELETIAGDGGGGGVDSEKLKELKEEVAAICESQAKGSYSSESLNARFCIWPGQHDDGLKHGDRFTGPVEPFEGAVDSRVRDVDLVVNDEVKLQVVSALMARLTVADPTGENAAAAAKMQSALEYYLKTKLGSKWFRALTRVSNFMNGDTPGIGFLAANWVHEKAVGYAELTLEDLLQRFLESAAEQQEGMEPEFVQQLAATFQEAVFDPETGEDSLIGLIGQLFGDLKPGRVRKMAKALLKQARAGVENPVVDYPETYVRKDEPEVKALRLGEDIFLPSDVSDFEDGPYYFMVDNLTRSGVEAKAKLEEWSADFKKQVLGIEDDGLKGRFAFRRYARNDLGELRTVDDAYAAHRWQVITAVYTAVNDDGVPGIYYLTFHPDVAVPAHGAQLINYTHGKYPVVAFVREYISNSLLESRGVAEVWGAQQNQRKQLLDAGSNNALLGGVPPVLSKNRRGGGRAWLKPFKEVPLRRDGELKYMDPPKYPAQVRDMFQSLERDRDQYFGRRNKDLEPASAELHEQYAVMNFMCSVRDVLLQLMQLIQQFASDEDLQRISEQDGQLIRSREEITGLFDLELEFNPKWMDTDYLKAYGEIVKGLVVVLDRDKTIDTAPIAQQMMYALDPQLAPSVIRGKDAADADEIQDEQSIFAKIAAGIEPDLDEDPTAKNFELRFQWLQQQLESNPGWQTWPEMNQEILKGHLENYQQMLVQQENAHVGRAGTESVTGMV